MLVGGDLIWWWRYHSLSASWYDQDKTITTQGSIIRGACEKLWNLDLNNLKRSKLFAIAAQHQTVSVVCPLQSIISRSRKYVQLRLPTCQMDSWDRPNFSFYFAQPKKYRLVGCFHVDFGAKTLTVSSFSSLKRALIWNNMLTVNVFGNYGIWSVDLRLAERFFASEKGP